MLFRCKLTIQQVVINTRNITHNIQSRKKQES